MIKVLGRWWTFDVHTFSQWSLNLVFEHIKFSWSNFELIGKKKLRHIASSRYEGEHITFKVEMYFSVIAWRIVRCCQCLLCLRSTYSRLFILFSNCSWVVGDQGSWWAWWSRFLGRWWIFDHQLFNLILNCLRSTVHRRSNDLSRWASTDSLVVSPPFGWASTTETYCFVTLWRGAHYIQTRDVFLRHCLTNS